MQLYFLWEYICHAYTKQIDFALRIYLYLNKHKRRVKQTNFEKQEEGISHSILLRGKANMKREN